MRINRRLRKDLDNIEVTILGGGKPGLLWRGSLLDMVRIAEGGDASLIERRITGRLSVVLHVKPGKRRKAKHELVDKSHTDLASSGGNLGDRPLPDTETPEATGEGSPSVGPKGSARNRTQDKRKPS